MKEKAKPLLKKAGLNDDQINKFCSDMLPRQEVMAPVEIRSWLDDLHGDLKSVSILNIMPTAWVENDGIIRVTEVTVLYLQKQIPISAPAKPKEPSLIEVPKVAVKGK